MEAAVVTTIKLLLVDDHAMFREGLARVLERDPDFKIVGQCASSSQALAMLGPSGANMVLLDVDLGHERALDFVLNAKRRGFEGNILVVTAGISDQEAVQLVQSGVSGILHKQHSADILASTIRRVAAGEVFLEDEYLTPLFRSVDRMRQKTRPELTERDKEVLRCIFQGLTNKRTAERIQTTEGAIKASVRLLCEKLGVRTRAQLVKVALEQYRDQL